MAYIRIDSKAKVYPHGILGPASNVVRPGGEHWVGGFDVEYTRGGVFVSIHGGPCDTTRVPTEVVRAGVAFDEVLPFTVVSELVCSTLGSTRDDLEERLSSLLDADIQFAVEREFWALVQVGATPVPVTDLADAGDNFKNQYIAGLALAEGAVAEVVPGRLGTIHMSPQVASVVRLRKDGDELVTTNGSRVVVGQGYGNDSIAVTGDVTVVLGESIIRGEYLQRIDSSTNTVRLIVDTPASVVWNSPSAAIISLT